ncbi:MAG: prephenate dehydrogenase [Anaerolineales bacterium]
MTVQITIVGLGQLGASVGLALGNRGTDFHRVGHDKNPETAKMAQKKGAIDDVKYNLPAAVREADIVLLSLPVNEIRSALEVIAPDLPAGAVVMDTAPLQSAVAQWAQEILPERRYYVGLVPAINPLYLHRIEIGVDAAENDLFDGGVVMLATLPGVPEEAVKVATDMIERLGATPIFADMAETDGLMASTHIVPQLVAAALLNAVVDQPGWKEARKLAGRPFAALTSALVYQDEITSLGEAALLNSENVARVLDVVIGSLQGLRDDIANGNKEDISERLELALEGRRRWLGERLRGDWSTEMEKTNLDQYPNFMERLVGSRRRPKSEE